MVLRINQSRLPVWRQVDELQIGTGANQVVVTGLTPAQQRLVSLLCRGIPNDAIADVAKQIGAEQHEELLQKLEPAMIDRNLPPTKLDRDYIEANFAELCRVQAVHGIEGSHVVARRANAAVFLDDSAATEQLTAALLASGVGRVYTAKDKLREPKLARLDLAISFDQSAYRPNSHRRWLSLAVPQIAVLFDQVGVSISPLIEVGKTPCLTCLQLGASEQQISIDSQLLFSMQRFDDSVAQHFAIAMALQLALHHIDAKSGFEIQEFHRTGYQLDAHSGRIHEVSWQFSSACLCHQIA